VNIISKTNRIQPLVTKQVKKLADIIININKLLDKFNMKLKLKLQITKNDKLIVIEHYEEDKLISISYNESYRKVFKNLTYLEKVIKSFLGGVESKDLFKFLCKIKN